MDRNKHRNKLDRRQGQLYMVILPESELRKRSYSNLQLIERKARRLIGRIQGDGLSGHNLDEDQTTSAYHEYVRTIRKVMEEESVSA